ncbi:hypothetical protein NEMBOFW57_007003 [Staphylotrichum longicolle]|uniref:AMP-dependent synthetase/ligase domain-containing protein n=1 Tax=Staphylotrichum longicolle TaxID=669026 RepID=A0AAD4HY02_9PEZI|nr:hypothetical protein NEMBOFW57_007003 [Staphylotrichum longicolle]
MTTIFERTSSGIIYKPAKDRDFPQLDLLSFLFDSDASRAKDDSVLHADAADPSRSINKAQLRSLVERTAHTFRHQYGIGQNGPNKDVVLAICTGHYLLPNLFYSTVAADGIFSASNPGSTPKELATQLTQVSVKLLFCTEDTKPTALAAAKLANLPLSRVLCLSATSPTFQLVSSATSQPIPLSTTPHPWTRLTGPSPALRTNTICILFSSGTTGPPKACRLSHANMVSAAALVLDANREHYTSNNIPEPEYRTLAHLPAAHIAGIQGYFVNPFYVGGTVYWMPRFDFPAFLGYAKRYQVTFFFSVPPVFLAIAKSPAVADHFAAVTQAVSGAAPMGRELQAAAQKKLGGGRAQLSQTWGLSETTGSMTFFPLGEGQDETGSVSSLELIKYKGLQVAPAELEALLVSHPQILDAALSASRLRIPKYKVKFTTRL